MFLTALVLVSFVSAIDFEIIKNPDYNCTDPKICSFIIFNDTNGEINITTSNFTIIPFPKPDLIPPIISNVQANLITEDSAEITWETDKTTSGNWVEYGLDTNYGNVVTKTNEVPFNSNVTISDPLTNHSILLTNLNEGTTYHYRVHSCSLYAIVTSLKHCTYSEDYTFTTLTTQNQAPVFIGISVIPYMQIGDSYVFKVQVRDPDGDPIVIKWYLDGELVSSVTKYDSTNSSFGVVDEYNFTGTSVGIYNFKIVISNPRNISICLYDFQQGIEICPNSNFIEFDVQVHPKIIIIPFDQTPPEAIIKYNPEIKDIEVIGIDDIDEDVEVIYTETCEKKKCIRTYILKDNNFNTLTLNLNYQKYKNNLKVRIMDMKYHRTFAIPDEEIEAPKNLFSIASLEMMNRQYLMLGEEEVDAFYDSKKQETKIIIKQGEGRESYTEDGLMLINLLTDKGELKYSFG